MPYQDLGGDYFESAPCTVRKRQRLIRQLEALGVKVTVEGREEAA